MTVKLDRTRPFHEVTPPHLGAVYMQGPFYFTEDGSLVEALLDDDAKRKLNSVRIAAPPKEPKAPKAKDMTIGKTDDKKFADDVDLVAWAKGEAQYPFFKVNTAAISRWPDEAAACEGDAVKLKLLLVEKEVITLDDLPAQDADEE